MYVEGDKYPLVMRCVDIDTFFPFGFAKTALSEHGWGIIEKSNAKSRKQKPKKKQKKEKDDKVELRRLC